MKHPEVEKKTWEEVTSLQTSNHVANFRQRIYNGHGFKIISKGNGTLSQPPYAAVIHDEANGWGPDELFIKTIMPMQYTLYVERIGDQTISLEGSNAKISIYQNDMLV